MLAMLPSKDFGDKLQRFSVYGEVMSRDDNGEYYEALDVDAVLLMFRMVQDDALSELTKALALLGKVAGSPGSAEWLHVQAAANQVEAAMIELERGGAK